MLTKNQNESKEFFTTITKEELISRLQEIGVTTQHIKNHIEKYFYIIHTIYVNDVFDKNIKDGWVNLKSNILGKICGFEHYSIIIKNLINIGMIQENKSYNVGEYSKSYKLLENRNAFILDFPKSESKYNFIGKVIKSKNVFDISNPIKNKLSIALSNLEYDHIDLTTLGETELKFLHQLINNPFQIEGERGGRIYNNFSNLPKALRKSLKLGGEFLGFVDIVNSQMIFLSGVILQSLTLKNIEPHQSTMKFCNTAFEGGIYEMIMKLTGIIDRDEAKDLMFNFTFGSYYNQSNILRKIFLKEFPEIMEVLKEIKEKDYKILSHQMQRLESQLIYHAYNKLGFKALTVHDSIYSAESKVNDILVALIESFKVMGLKGKLNVNDKYNYLISDLSPSKLSNPKNDIQVKEIAFDVTVVKENEPVGEIDSINLDDLDLNNMNIDYSEFYKEINQEFTIESMSDELEDDDEYYLDF